LFPEESDHAAEERNRRIKIAAHHEAGHITAAATEGLSLRPEGFCVDWAGNGLACYCKEPGPDDLSRKRVIVATFAGLFAEMQFCREQGYPVVEKDWGHWADGHGAYTVLSQIEKHDMGAGNLDSTQSHLERRSESLVAQNWEAICALANFMLEKHWEPVKPLLSSTRWTNEALAKYITVEEEIALLALHGIRAACDASC
jgi:hypothetical protein